MPKYIGWKACCHFLCFNLLSGGASTLLNIVALFISSKIFCAASERPLVTNTNEIFVVF